MHSSDEAQTPKARAERLERQMAEQLTEGEMDREDPDQAARRRLRPPYEIRIQTERDPIVEETERYRELAEEVSDRYDDYMRRAKGKSQNSLK